MYEWLDVAGFCFCGMGDTSTLEPLASFFCAVGCICTMLSDRVYSSTGGI